MTTPLISSAGVSVGRVCFRHNDAGASLTCSTCRRSICDACVSVGNNFSVVCVSCASESRRRANVVTGAAIGAAALVFVGVGAFVATRPPAFEYKDRLEVNSLEARVAQNDCDGQATLEFANLLNKEGDFSRVISVVDSFRERCTEVPRLYWESYGARMAVQDWTGAVDDASRLVQHDPDDGDFWWWRAKAKRKAGDLAGAEADFKKSADVAGKDAFYAVIDLADLLEDQHRACEGAPRLAALIINHKGDAERQGIDKTLARLVHEQGCADPLAAVPKDATSIASLCSTLPAKLTFDDGRAASGFEFALASTWQARTRTQVSGAAVVCRAEVAQNGEGGVMGSALLSFTARLTCSGLAPVTSTTLAISGLKAQELLTAKLIDRAISSWCGP